jgi:hypothetical protein
MAHKLFPVLVPADADTKAFHARSLPVLDSQRLAQLEAPMPPVYRSEHSSSPDGKESGASPRTGGEGEHPSPRNLLTSFINTTFDSLARQWGKPAVPASSQGEDTIAYRWIEALFSKNPTVKTSPA